MKSELQKLVALQECDIKIRDIEKEIANIPNQKADIENQFNTIAAQYLNKKNRLEATRKEHRQLEIDLSELEAKLEKFKQDLMRVKNEREYSAVLREIDVTKKTISALETDDLQKLDLIEEMEKEIERLTPEIDVKRREFDALIEECSSNLEQHDANLGVLRRQRVGLVDTIPSDLLARYDRLTQLRDSLALAEVLDGSCTACFMTIRPQVYADVRKGEQIITCDNCSRILYYVGNAQLKESQSAG